MRVTPAPVWNYLFPDSPLSSPYPSAFIVFPENPSLFPRPGVGRAHEKGLLMPLFVLQKILKFKYNLSRMGNTIIR